MRPIRLPEPPSPTATAGTSETFEVGAYGIILGAIGNGSSGAENQSLGLIHTLGLSDKHVLYRLTRPKGGVNEWLHWLPFYLHKCIDYVIRKTYSYSRLMITSRGKTFADMPSEKGSSGVGLASILEADVKQIVNMALQSYEKDGPLLVVACGRDTISISSSIKRLASENVFVIQEQVPQFLRWWITPSEPLDKHVVLTLGALHQIDFAALCNAASAWHDEFAPLPKPMLVVNIAGPTRCCRHGADLARQLAASLLSVLTSCGSISISFSNRTPQKISKIMIKAFADNPKAYIWDSREPNPYMGHFAWADAFVVTADSVSMISEACSTGKPVYVAGSEHCTWKLSDFHKSLRERGVARPCTGSEDISESWSYPPLNDTEEAARKLHEALAQRGWMLRP